MDNITQSDIKACLNKSPEEIVDFFKAKGCRITWDWQDDWQECQAKSFTVAKVMEMDFLQDIKNELVRALDSGETLQTFKSNLESVLAAKGWWKGKKEVTNPDTGETAEIELGSNRRMRQIFETNLTTSYRAGQYKQQWESRESRPWWMYVCKMLPTSREEHKALHGKVFRYDDPFWDSFYPPNGFNCRCDVIPLTEDEINKIEHYTLQPKLDKDGQPVVVNGIPQYEHVPTKIERCESTPTTLTQRNAQVTIDNRKMTYKQAFYQDGTMMNAVSTDRGWNYNPGKAVYFEPDLTKYDKPFVDAYLKMKAEFDKNWHRLSADAAGNGSVYAIGVLSKGESKIIKKLFDKIKDSEIKTGCDLSIYDYGTDAEINGELLRSEQKFSRNTIAISKKQYPELKSAFEKIINKTKNPNKNIVLTDAEITALTVYFHETVHNWHPKTLFDNGLSDVKIKIIECLVECMARKMTIDFVNIKFGEDVDIKEGNYTKYYNNIMKHANNIDYVAIENYLRKGDFYNIEDDIQGLLNCSELGKTYIKMEALRLQ